MDSEDLRRRPVVLRASATDAEPTRRPARFLAWAGTGLLGLVAAAGLVAGGTAVWSAFDPGTPGQSPAPLWFPPPETITPQSEKIAPTPTPTPAPTKTAEPGDDKGGERAKPTTKTSSSTSSSKSSTGSSSTSGKSTSGKHGADDSGKSGSGTSSDDGPNHH
jgi:hypothetical protein